MKAYFGKKRYRQMQTATHGTDGWRARPQTSPNNKNARQLCSQAKKAVAAL